MIESPLLPHLDAYIDGRWTKPASGKTFKVINPATGDHLADVASLSRDEVVAAIGGG
jgi:succinate-semialdehyde dehydrogenase/glutarate-semialdehyde dehydrogenase